MTELVKPPKSATSWHDYIEGRQAWLSSGSTGGKKHGSTNTRISKGLTPDEMVAWMDRTPIMMAVASEKFAMGKARAIYGTSTVDYSIASYALSGVKKLYNVDGS